MKSDKGLFEWKPYICWNLGSDICACLAWKPVSETSHCLTCEQIETAGTEQAC